MVQDCVFSPEFGVSVQSSEKEGYSPVSAGLEFGERTGIILVRQVRSSEKGQFLSPFSELRTLAGSEFGVRTGPNPGSAGTEFGERTGPNPGLAGSDGSFL